MRNSIILSFFAISLLLCGCDEGETTHYTIGFSQCADDPWRIKVNRDIQQEAMFYGNVEVIIRSTNGDSKQQIHDIETLVDQGVDLLIVSPNEAVAITPIVEKVYEKGIPIIIYDRKVLTDKYTAFIGADNYMIGESIGYYVAHQLKGRGKIVELTGLKGSSPAIERHQGFMSAIKDYPDLKLICSWDAAWRTDSATMAMNSILAQHDDIDLVYAHNDIMAYGAWLAAKNRECEGTIKFIGIDALSGPDGGVNLVANGILDATFIYPADCDKVIKLALDILQQKNVPRETILNTAIIDHSNVRVMELQATYINKQEQKIAQLNNKIYDYLAGYSKQKNIILLTCGALSAVLLMMCVVLFLLRAKSRLNRCLTEQNEDMVKQKRLLEAQRDQLSEMSNKIKEATQAKLVFFTNISHDLRTPLTLISDPLDRLIKNERLTPQDGFLLRLMRKNVDVLLRLVDQILDFRKYEAGKLVFNPTNIDLSNCIEGWNTSFISLLHKKFIRFSFSSTPGKDYRTVADYDKMERIYYNLLSNAFKHTPENGDIRVDLSSFEQSGKVWLQLKIYNSGSYIEESDRTLIFERLFQCKGSESGAGIGLALTKVFVEQHGGEIYVESDIREGTTFRIVLPVVKCDDMEMCQPNTPPSEVGKSRNNVFKTEELYVTTALPEDGEIPHGEETILVIDDNPDILAYLRHLLSGTYRIIVAGEGNAGIDKATTYLPDLIISDVMMPGIDGIECVHHLKTTQQTSHIPIILLTADTMDEQRLRGIKTGADLYICKPFDSELLLVSIKNLLENRSRLKSYFSRNWISLTGDNADKGDADFVDRFRTLIENNIENSELQLSDIAKMVGISKVQLYRKVKELTNLSPKEFLRITRLKYADFLLQTTKSTIAEIAYRAGFNSPTYFSRCYKNHFGTPPKETR